MRALTRRLLLALARRLLHCLARVEVAGLAQLPAGAAIIAPNHLSHWDPALVAAFLPKPPQVVGLAALRAQPVAPLFWLYGAMPVRRDEVDRALIAAVRAALARGESVLLFPEGRISRTGALEAARDGVGYLALLAEVPIVPAALTGTERLLDDLRRGRRGHLTLHFLPPIDPPPSLPNQPRRAQRQRLTEATMQCLAAALPAAYRGVYGAPPSAHGPPPPR